MKAIHGASQSRWGLFTRKERWGLSVRGKLCLFLMLLIAGFSLIKGLYPFLATTERANSDVLVVEGWVRPFAIRAAAEEFRSGHYRKILTTGGPISGSDYSWANVGVDVLKTANVPDSAIQSVPSRPMVRDRTYASAVALRNWFHQFDSSVRSINVVTEAVHARRTRLLFEEALGPELKVGVIGIPSPDYDSRHWWSNSEGFRDIVGEAIAYLYAKLVFYPSPPNEVRE